MAFSFARPLEKMHPVRPIASCFHPALFFSIMGQMVIHLGCMVYIVTLAKEAMGEDKLKEVLEFEKNRHKAIDNLGEEELEDVWWFMKMPFKPNLLNTMVWLVETSQQVSVLFVNYKGQPWMKGILENQALFLSLTLCTGLTWICASGVVPQLNEVLQLEIVPEHLRGTMIVVLFSSLGGTFFWDRMCHFIWAPEIFDVMVENVRNTKINDFVPVLKTVGAAILVLLVLGTGNILSLVGLYYMYKTWYSPEEEKKPSSDGNKVTDGAKLQ